MKKNKIVFFITLITMLFSTTVFSQEKKDTLYFHMDKSILLQSDFYKDKYYLNINTTEEVFGFKITEKPIKILRLTKTNILNFRKYLQEEYGGISKIHSFNLAKNLGKHVVFLIDTTGECNKSIKVSPFTEIE